MHLFLLIILKTSLNLDFKRLILIPEDEVEPFVLVYSFKNARRSIRNINQGAIWRVRIQRAIS